MKYSQAKKAFTSKMTSISSSSSSSHDPNYSPNDGYLYNTLEKRPKSTSERMPISGNLSRKIILREGHITGNFLDENVVVANHLARQGWIEYAMSKLIVLEILVRWFYKYVNISTTNDGYSSIATWRVQVNKNGEIFEFAYNSKNLERDFGMEIFGFEDLSLLDEKSENWKPSFQRMKMNANLNGHFNGISRNEKTLLRLVQTIFMPSTNTNIHQTNAQYAIASKLFIEEPINLPVVIAKHMMDAQSQATTQTLPYGGLITFIMKKWLLLRPFGIIRESFYFTSDIFEDQVKIIQELSTKHDFRYESEPSDVEDEPEDDYDPEMMEDEEEAAQDMVETSDERDGQYESYTLEERMDEFVAQTYRRHERILTSLRLLREDYNVLMSHMEPEG